MSTTRSTWSMRPVTQKPADPMFCHTAAISSRLGRLAALSIVMAIAIASLIADRIAVAQDETDPAEWGSDHVGAALPLYMSGDECLFCHRDVGDHFQTNWHNIGMRNVSIVSDEFKAALDSAEAAEFGPGTTYTLGGRRTLRFLKPNDRYGQFAIHRAAWNPHTGAFSNADAGWDSDVFANDCAGCHTTAVETGLQAFAAPSLDCFTCHGDTPAGHQNEPKLALFAKGAAMDPRVEMAICGSCHLRGGTSASTGLPYPNQFVPGDNLFKDFRVDLGPDAIEGMNPGDAHIFQNVRDVLLGGQTGLTCVSCHDIHGESSRKHRVLRRLERPEYCAICHDNAEDYSSFIKYDAHSAVCQY